MSPNNYIQFTEPKSSQVPGQKKRSPCTHLSSDHPETDSKPPSYCQREMVPWVISEALDSNRQASPLMCCLGGLYVSKRVTSPYYLPNAGKSFIGNNANSIECAINQHNHGDNLAVWGGVSNNSLRPLKYHLSHQVMIFWISNLYKGPLETPRMEGSPRSLQLTCNEWLPRGFMHRPPCPALPFSRSLSLQGKGKTTATGGLEGPMTNSLGNCNFVTFMLLGNNSCIKMGRKC